MPTPSNKHQTSVGRRCLAGDESEETPLRPGGRGGGGGGVGGGGGRGGGGGGGVGGAPADTAPTRPLTESGRRRPRLRPSRVLHSHAAAAFVMTWVLLGAGWGGGSAPRWRAVGGCTSAFVVVLLPRRRPWCVRGSSAAGSDSVGVRGSSPRVVDGHADAISREGVDAWVQRVDDARDDRPASSAAETARATPIEKVVNEPRRQTVRFVSPLLTYGYRPAVDEWTNGTSNRKPLLLYLPGFDGTYLSPFLQFPELGTLFDIRCMVMPMDDRSTFKELKEAVLSYLRSEAGSPPMRANDAPDGTVNGSTSAAAPPAPASRNPLAHVFGGGGGSRAKADPRGEPNLRAPPPPRPPRPLYLAGESFGGVLAVEVATALLEDEAAARQPSAVTLRGLALINAATCYDRSRLAALGPSVAEYHPWLYPVGLVWRLVPLFTDEHSFRQLLLMLRGIALPSVIDDEAREAYLGRVALSLPFVLPIMTQEALRWRLHQWLAVGCEHLVSAHRVTNLASLLRRTPKASFKVLVVAGENDAALPSIAEAERLASVLPGAHVHVVEGAGHASTCGSRVDLAALFRRCYPDDLQQKGPGGAPESPSSSSSSSNSVLWNWSSHRAWAGRADASAAGRTEMKPVAAAGVNEYFGMEPRYDNSTIGLSPLLYWSSKYYRKYEPPKPPAVPSSVQPTEEADSGHQRVASTAPEAEQLNVSAPVPDAVNESAVVS